MAHLKAVERARHLYPWAEAIANMRGRACTISQLTGVTDGEARRLYKEITGLRSPSGQQPVDLSWYTATPTRRYQSALLLLLFERASRTYPAGLAFAHAYYHFSSLTAGEWRPADDPDNGGPFRSSERDYAISFARANLLVNFYSDELDLHGARKSSLQIVRCRSCTCAYLAETHEADHHCPICIKARERMARERS